MQRTNSSGALSDDFSNGYAYQAGTNKLTSVTNASSQVESYTYNAHGQLATMTEPDGAVTQYTYTAAGQRAAPSPRNISPLAVSRSL